MKTLISLSDSELIKRLERLCDSERELMVTMLRYLIEVEKRELYIDRGYGSLYEFCTGHLKYSGSAAHRRITAARCLGRYPRIAPMLRRGEINLSVLSLVADLLTPENHRTVLDAIKGRSYRDVERLTARFRPQRAARERVKPVYIKTAVTVSSGDDSQRLRSKGEGEKASTSDVGSSGCLESTGYGDIFGLCENGVKSEVLLEEKYELRFTVNAALMEKIERVRELLSTRERRKPEFETLFELMVDEYLERHSPESRIKRREKRKKSRSQAAAGSGDSRNKTNSKRSRHIPQAVRDKVYMRDGGRCTFTSSSGRRCTKKDNVQIDHIIPYAKGGKNTIDNLRLLCARHNIHAAEDTYGKDHMKQYRQRE